MRGGSAAKAAAHLRCGEARQGWSQPAQREAESAEEPVGTGQAFTSLHQGTEGAARGAQEFQGPVQTLSPYLPSAGPGLHPVTGARGWTRLRRARE